MIFYDYFADITLRHFSLFSFISLFSLSSVLSFFFLLSFRCFLSLSSFLSLLIFYFSAFRYFFFRLRVRKRGVAAMRACAARMRARSCLLMPCCAMPRALASSMMPFSLFFFFFRCFFSILLL